METAGFAVLLSSVDLASLHLISEKSFVNYSPLNEKPAVEKAYTLCTPVLLFAFVLVPNTWFQCSEILISSPISEITHLVHHMDVLMSGVGRGTAQPNSGFQWHYFAQSTVFRTLEPVAWEFLGMFFNRPGHMSLREREREKGEKKEKEKKKRKRGKTDCWNYFFFFFFK